VGARPSLGFGRRKVTGALRVGQGVGAILVESAAMSFRTALLIGAIACASADAGAEALQLGIQDFEDGQILACFSACANGWTSAADPFNLYAGSDPGISGATDFAAEWSFDLRSLSLGQIRSVRLELGLFDHDSSAPGSQVASFFSTAFGDLTAELSAALEVPGVGAQQQYDVFSLELFVDEDGPSSRSLAEDIARGSTGFALRLKGPVWVEDRRTQQPVLAQGTNGAGLDFARLSFTSGGTVPEPASVLLLPLGCAALAAVRRPE